MFIRRVKKSCNYCLLLCSTCFSTNCSDCFPTNRFSIVHLLVINKGHGKYKRIHSIQLRWSECAFFLSFHPITMDAGKQNTSMVRQCSTTMGANKLNNHWSSTKHPDNFATHIRKELLSVYYPACQREVTTASSMWYLLPMNPRFPRGIFQTMHKTGLGLTSQHSKKAFIQWCNCIEATQPLGTRRGSACQMLLWHMSGCKSVLPMDKCVHRPSFYKHSEFLHCKTLLINLLETDQTKALTQHNFSCSRLRGHAQA